MYNRLIYDWLSVRFTKCMYCFCVAVKCETERWSHWESIRDIYPGGEQK